MSRYLITNKTSGAVFGVYQGTDVDDALDCYARDAGYRDYSDACLVGTGASVVATLVDDD
jgi:hypothetical protein